MSIAQRVASTALENSASTESPAVLNIRPPARPGNEILVDAPIGIKARQRILFVLCNQP